MEGILLLFVCLITGIFLRGKTGADGEGARVLNQLIIYFFLPLLALYQIPRVVFEWKLIWLTISPFIIFGVSFLIHQLLAKVFGFDRNTKAALILTSGIGSTSFVGFPIFEFLYGDAGLAYGIFLSLGGTILVFNTAGLATIFYYSDTDESPFRSLFNTLLFPPFTAFLIALLMNVSGLMFPTVIQSLLKTLTAPFAVIALLSIGMQVEVGEIRGVIRPLIVGQIIKLLFMPMVIYFIMWHLVGQRDLVARICILGAAIGSMSSVSILAAERGLRPQLSLLMPSVGIPLSIPLLYALDKYLL